MSDRWAKSAEGASPAQAGLHVWRYICLTLAFGLALGLLGMGAMATGYKATLRTRIDAVAAAMDGDRIAGLVEGADTKNVAADYAYVKSKLTRIKQAYADARFVYIMARRPDGTVYFLADSEPEGSPANSPRGEVYPEATVALRAMFQNRQLLIEGPASDSFGTWLSALAPLDNGRRSGTPAVIGMDVPSRTYLLLVGMAGGLPLLLAVMASVIMYVRLQNQRRHQEHVQFRAEMISIASHELRTPLTGLRWSTESLLAGKLKGDKQQRALEIMYDSISRLQDSIEDILQLAGMESGKAQRLFKKETDLRDMMDDILAVQRLAADRRTVSLTYSANWPGQLVMDCDVQKLKRVFSNLVSNAVKYSKPESTVTIGYEQSKHGGHIISITDQGIGIPAAEQSRVWEGFYRATNTTAHDITGTGMGLYLARTVVEQHGGRIWLESQEGKGTTVSVELPDMPPPATPGVPPAQTRG